MEFVDKRLPTRVIEMAKQERERLLLPHHEAKRGAGELVGLAQLIL